jgi:hypothetical protein
MQINFELSNTAVTTLLLLIAFTIFEIWINFKKDKKMTQIISDYEMKLERLKAELNKNKDLQLLEIKSNYDEKLEGLKSDLLKKLKLYEKIVREYPRIFELVHKTFRLVRDMPKDTINDAKMVEIEINIKILEDELDKNYFFLQMDKIWDPFHQYKKSLENFYSQMKIQQKSMDNRENLDQSIKDINDYYEEIRKILN